MGPYKSSCVVMDSNGSLWVLMRPYVSLWFVIGLLASLRIPIGSYGYL